MSHTFGKTDCFEILGRGAPIVRAIFDGVSFPIQNLEELIINAGGQDRIIKITEPNGIIKVFSLLDILDSVPWIRELFPFEKAEDVVVKFARSEQQRRKERRISPLLKIRNKHLMEIYSKKSISKSKPITETLLEPTPTDNTISILLKSIQSEESLKFLNSQDLRVKEWMDWVVKNFIEKTKEKAINGAAKAKTLANEVNILKQKAWNAVLDVGSQTTNSLIMQKVDIVCNNANQAVSIAQQVVNAKESVYVYATSFPENTEIQMAYSEAQIAASSAQADANSALDACKRAQDIASISIVTIRGHVTEEDPCCNDDWEGAYIQVNCNDYPEIEAKSAYTDGSGNYSITGRFGHSSRIGCARIQISFTVTQYDQNPRETREITICSNNVPPQNFSFDASGIE